jgi:hypothetical protein
MQCRVLLGLSHGRALELLRTPLLPGNLRKKVLSKASHWCASIVQFYQCSCVPLSPHVRKMVGGFPLMKVSSAPVKPSKVIPAPSASERMRSRIRATARTSRRRCSWFDAGRRPVRTLFENAPHGSHPELMDAARAIKDCVAYGPKPRGQSDTNGATSMIGR